MRLIQTQAPAVEPVTLDFASLHLRQIDTVEDSLITMFLVAARRYAESYCRRSFITQGWRLVLDEFPECEIELPRGPVTAVSSIVYLDMAGVAQTIASPALPDYVFDNSGDADGVLARLSLGFGRTWPNTLPQAAAVQVNYTAGYGADPASVPEGIRHWICMRVNTLFENREEVAVLQRGSVSALPHVDRLLDPYQVLRA